MPLDDLPHLRQRIGALEAELAALKLEAAQFGQQPAAALPRQLSTGLPMELEEYERYGRQMILPGMGLPAQLKLRSASVLVVGAGALGCPALQYLAAAGVGHIGIVDHDTVARSNLHRQVLHSETTIDWLKVESAQTALQRLNPQVKITPHPLALSPSNATSLFRDYDLILDCTDRPFTRYLISDAAVLASKPLVSGAAVGFNGQLAVYGSAPQAPCYRCVWSRVAKVKAGAGTCEEEGVLGPVTGVVGTLMALEAVKLLAGLVDYEQDPPGLTIFSALSATPFRTFKLRRRQPLCRSCGTPPADAPFGERKIRALEEEDYEAFCGGPEGDRDVEGMDGVGLGGGRISELETLLDDPVRREATDVIDVRTPEQFSIIAVPGSRNVPLPKILAEPLAALSAEGKKDVVFLCRRGNDSQDAALALSAALRAQRERVDEEGEAGDGVGRVVDVRGGVKRWGKEVKGGLRGGWPEY